MALIFLNQTSGLIASGSAFFPASIPIEQKMVTETSPDVSTIDVLLVPRADSTIPAGGLEYTSNDGDVWTKLNPDRALGGGTKDKFNVTLPRPFPAGGWYFNLRHVTGAPKYFKICDVHLNNPSI
jgi:hypothetical protein